MKREPVYHDGRVVGILEGDTYRQQYDSGHIYRRLNAKGMNKGIYLYLKGKGCQFWMITHKQTKESLTVPFWKIKELGIEQDMGKDGIQIFVKLEDFNMTHPAIQSKML